MFTSPPVTEQNKSYLTLSSNIEFVIVPSNRGFTFYRYAKWLYDCIMWNIGFCITIGMFLFDSNTKTKFNEKTLIRVKSVRTISTYVTWNIFFLQKNSFYNVEIEIRSELRCQLRKYFGLYWTREFFCECF
jgi:hypothetical protein